MGRNLTQSERTSCESREAGLFHIEIAGELARGTLYEDGLTVNGIFCPPTRAYSAIKKRLLEPSQDQLGGVFGGA